MYALTAAEYAAGYVFAVDAGYNLVAMVPGVWNRMEICNLGFSVSDLSWDAATNTMYMLAKVDGVNLLMTLDIETGETELVCELGDSPVYAIEFTENGEMYAIISGSASLWKMNWEEQYLESVMDFTGEEYPYYSQSMTYDAENN
jgi:hypothetical protein